MIFVLIGEGGKGGDVTSSFSGQSPGGGGGAGQIVAATNLPVTAGQALSISTAPTGITLTIGSESISAYSGNPASGTIGGIAGDNKSLSSDVSGFVGSNGDDANTGTATGGNGGPISTDLLIGNPPYGGGGGGAGTGGGNGLGVNGGQDGTGTTGGAGGPAFYGIVLFPSGYTGLRSTGLRSNVSVMFGGPTSAKVKNT